MTGLSQLRHYYAGVVGLKSDTQVQATSPISHVAVTVNILPFLPSPFPLLLVARRQSPYNHTLMFIAVGQC